MGPPPGRRVEGQLVDVEPAGLTGHRLAGCGCPGRGPARRRRGRTARRSAAGGPGRWPWTRRPTPTGGCRRWTGGRPGTRRGWWPAPGRRWSPGMPTSAMPEGHGDGRLRVVVGRVLDPHRIDGDADVCAGQGGEGHRARPPPSRAPGCRPAGAGRRWCWPLSVGHGQLGRDRVLAVGGDLQVEVVEGDRLGEPVLEPVAGLVGGAEARLPQGRRSRRPGWRWPRPGGRRAAGRASRPRCRCRRPRAGPPGGRSCRRG